MNLPDLQILKACWGCTTILYTDATKHTGEPCPNCGARTQSYSPFGLTEREAACYGLPVYREGYGTQVASLDGPEPFKICDQRKEKKNII